MTRENSLGKAISRVVATGLIGAVVGSGVYATDTKDIQLKTETVWHIDEKQTNKHNGVWENAVNWKLLKTIETRKPPVMKPDIITLESGAIVVFSEKKLENKGIIAKIENKLDSDDFVYVNDGEIFVSTYELEEGSKIAFDNKGVYVISDEGKITDRLDTKTKELVKVLDQEIHTGNSFQK